MLSNYQKWALAYPNAQEASNTDYDRMVFLENNSSYEFSSADKAKQITKEVMQEAENSYTNINSVFNNIGEGISNTAKTAKYLPFLIFAATAFFLYKKVEKA